MSSSLPPAAPKPPWLADKVYHNFETIIGSLPWTPDRQETLPYQRRHFFQTPRFLLLSGGKALFEAAGPDTTISERSVSIGGGGDKSEGHLTLKTEG